MLPSWISINHPATTKYNFHFLRTLNRCTSVPYKPHHPHLTNMKLILNRNYPPVWFHAVAIKTATNSSSSHLMSFLIIIFFFCLVVSSFSTRLPLKNIWHSNLAAAWCHSVRNVIIYAMRLAQLAQQCLSRWCDGWCSIQSWTVWENFPDEGKKKENTNVFYQKMINTCSEKFFLGTYMFWDDIGISVVQGVIWMGLTGGLDGGIWRCSWWNKPFFV